MVKHAHPLCPVLSLSHSKKYFITLIFYEEREHDSFERNFRAQRTYGHACGTSNAKKERGYDAVSLMWELFFAICTL